ncbi:MAG: GGDEF domain-containing protein, partial [Rubrivivax sp.]|nr:GGDEF domain-containing protein [Rubrivivax sp.]
SSAPRPRGAPPLPGTAHRMEDARRPDSSGSQAPGLLGVIVPPGAAGIAGLAAALAERGASALAFGVTALLLGAWSLWAGLRRRKAVADALRLSAEHRMLRESVENNPMPFAVYDDRDHLIAWNKAYEATHAEAFRRLRDRAAQGRLLYGDLVRVTAEATLPADEVAAHVAQRVRQQRVADGVGVDREYPGLGWLRVCKFATPSGAVAGFALDINELKEREAALKAQIGLTEALARQLRELADTDALTGTASRRAFMERAAAEFQRARRYGHGLTVAMLDIDDFKGVNDRHGHGVGDQVLARVAAMCMAQLRDGTDHCGRLGGEEFGILLPETELAGAQATAERLRAAIRELAFEASGRGFAVSASIGVAELNPGDESFDGLLARADMALYQAKAMGRDRVVLAAA